MRNNELGPRRLQVRTRVRKPHVTPTDTAPAAWAVATSVGRIANQPGVDRRYAEVRGRSRLRQ